MSDIMIGWTTAGDENAAKTLAEELVHSKLAACVQLDSPITSWYEWNGKVENETEYRLAIKFPAANAHKIKEWLGEHHPYEEPQWIVVSATDSMEGYRKWVSQCSMSD